MPHAQFSTLNAICFYFPFSLLILFGFVRVVMHTSASLALNEVSLSHIQVFSNVCRFKQLVCNTNFVLCFSLELGSRRTGRYGNVSDILCA